MHIAAGFGLSDSAHDIRGPSVPPPVELNVAGVKTLEDVFFFFKDKTHIII